MCKQSMPQFLPVTVCLVPRNPIALFVSITEILLCNLEYMVHDSMEAWLSVINLFAAHGAA